MSFQISNITRIEHFLSPHNVIFIHNTAWESQDTIPRITSGALFGSRAPIGAGNEGLGISLGSLIQPGDFEGTLTVVYGVITEALDSAGTWILNSSDNDGTATAVATGTGTGTTIAVHTVSFVVNSTNRSQVGYAIAIAAINGGVGAGSIIDLFQIRWVAKRPLEFIRGI